MLIPAEDLQVGDRIEWTGAIATVVQAPHLVGVEPKVGLQVGDAEPVLVSYWSGCLARLEGGR